MGTDWRAVANVFEADGSLRDIYVLDATPADWQATLELVRACYAPLRFTIDDEPAELPIHVEDVLAFRPDASPRLNFPVGGIDLACHFFGADEVEFDLLPSAVDGPERLAALLAFLGRLALATGKPVLLTGENLRDVVYFRADPATGAVEHMAPS